MPRFIRRHRDSYLRTLALEPLLQGVPRALIAVVGRGVDVVCVAAGESLGCTPAREAIIVIEGHARRTRADHRRPIIVGPGDAIADAAARGAAARGAATERLIALTDLRCFVIARRELPGLVRIAPGLASAIERAGGSAPSLRATPIADGPPAPRAPCSTVSVEGRRINEMRGGVDGDRTVAVAR